MHSHTTTDALIPTSPILAMARRAAALRAAGHDVIDLTLGEPDFAPPAHVVDAAMRHAHTSLGYSPSNGMPLLRSAICAASLRDRGVTFEDDQVTVGCGAKQIIFNTFLATLEPGDEVILPSPYWASYPDMIRMMGATPVILSGLMDDGFRVSPEALEAAITPCSRWLVLNAPGNPTGATYDSDQLDKLAQVLRRHPHVRVLSDEIYAHIRHDGRAHASIRKVAPDLHDRVLVVDGVSKAYAMTGWRVGWGLGPAPLIARITAIQGQNCTQTSTLSQLAAAAALDGPQDILTERNTLYRQRRDAAMVILSGSKALEVAAPDGAFYLFPRLTGTPDDQAMAEQLLEAGVAVVPGTAFGAPGFLRLSCATGLDILSEGCRRIIQALEGKA